MPKHFKKIIAVVLAASLAASLAGCADENADNKKMYLLNLYDDIIELVESYQHVVTLG